MSLKINFEFFTIFLKQTFKKHNLIAFQSSLVQYATEFNRENKEQK